MSSGAQQLSKDFEQVQKMLESYPNIRIIKTEGNPPEQYDIEYTIKGYKTNPDGSASPDNKHEVHITLPFGYPHFPPTAKPITPIFHPDIDPDAIRIADFWQQNNSLPELIIHIGQMICGNHYTTEEPFNQAAFEWFEERKSWLPFDVLEPRDEEDTPQVSGKVSEASNSKAEKTFVPASHSDLDILKDDIDFPFDDDEETGDSVTELNFGVEEETQEQPEEDSSDELDFGLDLEEDSTELFDFEATAEEDIFDLASADSSDDISLSFNLDDTEEPSPQDVALAEAGDLFELDIEPSDEESPGELTPDTKDSEDFAAAFAEESVIPEESAGIDITLDDLAGLEEDDEEMDFGIADEPVEMSDNATADLSVLEKLVDEEIPGEETSSAAGDDEDLILSSLSLDESFTAEERAEEQSLAIRNLIEQKQIYTAKKILADHPDPNSIPAKQEFDLTIADAIREAEDLYKTADKHEKKGEFEKAGIILDLVANIATDFPGLEMSRNKIRESMMGGVQKKPEDDTKQKKPDQFVGQKTDEVQEQSGKKKKSRTKLQFKIPVRLIIILAVLLILGGIGGGAAYIYNADDQVIQKAHLAVQQAEQLVERKDFTEAKKQFATVQTTLNEIIFFQQEEKERILKQISSITGSSLFREGLQGRVLHGEIYVTIEAAKAIDKYNTQIAYAETVLKDGKLDQAIAAYEKSLPYAEKAGLQREFNDISRKINELRLQLTISKAEEAEQKLDWLTARNEYASALEYSTSVATPQEQEALAKKLAAVSYHYGLQTGLKAINESQWQQSIEAFQEVKKVFEEHPAVVSAEEKIEIDKLLVQANLYFYLAEAKKSFEQRIWQEAVDTYNDAIALLKQNLALIGEEGKNNITRIEKTILTTHIAEQQAAIELANASNDLKSTVEHYQKITSLIENSSFKNDPTLADILLDARTKTVEIKNQLLKNEKETWLTKNYEQIFLDNYPSAKSSQFSNPKVRFIKRDGNIMIFNISCTELKQGRKFRLELNYQNDLDTNKWKLYSGKIEDE